jgi:hypothetical protein
MTGHGAVRRTTSSTEPRVAAADVEHALVAAQLEVAQRPGSEPLLQRVDPPVRLGAPLTHLRMITQRSRDVHLIRCG